MKLKNLLIISSLFVANLVEAKITFKGGLVLGGQIPMGQTRNRSMWLMLNENEETDKEFIIGHSAFIASANEDADYVKNNDGEMITRDVTLVSTGSKLGEKSEKFETKETKKFDGIYSGGGVTTLTEFYQADKWSLGLAADFLFFFSNEFKEEGVFGTVITKKHFNFTVGPQFTYAINDKFSVFGTILGNISKNNFSVKGNSRTAIGDEEKIDKMKNLKVRQMTDKDKVGNYAKLDIDKKVVFSSEATGINWRSQKDAVEKAVDFYNSLDGGENSTFGSYFFDVSFGGGLSFSPREDVSIVLKGSYAISSKKEIQVDNKKINAMRFVASDRSISESSLGDKIEILNPGYFNVSLAIVYDIVK